MADPRFFDRAGPFSLDALARVERSADCCDPDDGGRAASTMWRRSKPPDPRTSAFSTTANMSTHSRARAPAPRLSTRRSPDERRPEWRCWSASEPYKAFALAAQAFYPRPPVVAAPGAIGDHRSRRRSFPMIATSAPNVVIEARRAARRALPGRRQYRDRRRGRARRRLPDRRQCDAQPLPDRRARRAASRACGSARTGSALRPTRRRRSRSRSSAG